MKQIFNPSTFKVDWHYRTILIVEDVMPNYIFLKNLLASTKATILHAKSGGEAINICTQNNEIDLVLMDLHLPGMSGYEATQKLKEIRNDLTIIAQTAFVFSGEKQKCLDAGCDDYIAKPIKSEELIFRLQSCLHKAGKEA
jgi:two-component system, cell cycle response regulator DivK